MAARLWVDVEDLFEYARGNKRPSGIQRLTFEIYNAMQQRYGDSGVVRFVRHDSLRNSFRTVPWREVETTFEALTSLEGSTDVRLKHGISPHPPIRRFAHKVVYRLAPALRPTLIGAVQAQGEAFRAWARLAREVSRGTRHRVRQILCHFRIGTLRRSEAAGAAIAVADTFAEYAGTGDIVLVLGAPWSHPDYAALIKGQRLRGLRFALLVYDLIPIRRPEWCDGALGRWFREWLQTLLRECDFAFAISRATAADVEAYACENGIALPGPVIPIPIGSGFGTRPARPAKSHERALPSAGSYVLFVSTIEARKNHTLLFRVWRRLLEDMPAEQVPTLVFAGRIGWLVDDLMRQIANSDYLNGKLVLIEDPTDSELVTLYHGCLFTIFPSYHEGWGLPVTESLSFGKPCIISNRTSLPEAGGKLTRSFDPDNLHDAYQVIRQVIGDRAGLARWEAEVRREFTPVLWSDTVEAILTGLGWPYEPSLTSVATRSGPPIGSLLAESA